MSAEQSLRIPKNKSTGNLALPVKDDASPASQRTRFSFDTGTAQEMNSLKRWDLYSGNCGTRFDQSTGLLASTTMDWEDPDYEGSDDKDLLCELPL